MFSGIAQSLRDVIATLMVKRTSYRQKAHMFLDVLVFKLMKIYIAEINVELQELPGGGQAKDKEAVRV